MSQEYAYVPTGMNDFDSRMSFKERLINMLGCELFFPLRKYFLLGLVLFSIGNASSGAYNKLYFLFLRNAG